MCTFAPTNATATPLSLIQQPYSFSTYSISLTVTPVSETFNPVTINQYPACSNIVTNVGDVEKISLSVFPNPSAGIFKIKSDQNILKGSIKLYDIFGKQIPLNISINVNEVILIEIMSKNNGLYFLEGKTIVGNYFREKIVLN